MSLKLLSNLAVDLILEIGCKLRYNSLSIFLVNTKLLQIYRYNEKYIIKKIINSYNSIFTDLSNILFLNKIKGKTDYLYFHRAIKDGNLNDIYFFIKNGEDICHDGHSSLFVLCNDRTAHLYRTRIGYKPEVFKFLDEINHPTIQKLIEIGRLK